MDSRGWQQRSLPESTRWLEMPCDLEPISLLLSAVAVMLYGESLQKHIQALRRLQLVTDL